MKSVLITGAVRNSGLGIARKFLKEGWQTVITSRNEEDAKSVAAELQAEFGIPCFGFGYSPLDALTDTDVLFDKINEAGIELDSVVCNAADLGRWMDPLTVDPIAWQNVIITNVMGYFMVAREAVKQMIKNRRAKGATVVFVGSINYKDALPERSAYVASKGAIASMTKALALDFAEYGVRVNCLAPGAIWTTRYDEMDVKEAEARRNKIPLKEFSTKETMGEQAYFLATGASFPMTGSVLIVDGGSDAVMSGGF
jgi:NAD(P)-dependent dehydrogenase (short-subunit alcohol dehydrogenase family)